MVASGVAAEAGATWQSSNPKPAHKRNTNLRTTAANAADLLVVIFVITIANLLVTECSAIGQEGNSLWLQLPRWQGISNSGIGTVIEEIIPGALVQKIRREWGVTIWFRVRLGGSLALPR